MRKDNTTTFTLKRLICFWLALETLELNSTHCYNQLTNQPTNLATSGRQGGCVPIWCLHPSKGAFQGCLHYNAVRSFYPNLTPVERHFNCALNLTCFKCALHLSIAECNVFYCCCLMLYTIIYCQHGNWTYMLKFHIRLAFLLEDNLLYHTKPYISYQNHKNL